MKYAQHFLLALLVSGLMVIPGVAQSSSNSNQQQSAEQTGQMPNPQASNGQYDSGNTGAQSNKESSDRFASGSMSDKQFIRKAAEDDVAEVQVAQLAQQKASDNNLKQMAQHLMSDHQQNEQQLKQIAQQQGVTWPTQPDKRDKAKYDRLSKLNGQQFDKAFIREQVKDHKKDVAIFQRESQDAKDQTVKQYASQTLPTLQQHLQMVESSTQQLGVNAGGGGMHHHHKGSQTSASNSHSQNK